MFSHGNWYLWMYIFEEFLNDFYFLLTVDWEESSWMMACLGK